MRTRGLTSLVVVAKAAVVAAGHTWPYLPGGSSKGSSSKGGGWPYLPGGSGKGGSAGGGGGMCSV